MHIVQLLLDKGANAFVVDRWGNHPMADAVREGHKQVASLLGTGMDQKAAGDAGLAEFLHMEELRNWLLKAGFKDGRGLHGVLETLDSEEIDTIDLLKACWAEIKPMMRKGPAARVSMALGQKSI